MIALAIPNELCAQSEPEPFRSLVRRHLNAYSLPGMKDAEHGPSFVDQANDTSQQTGRIDRLERELNALKQQLHSSGVQPISYQPPAPADLLEPIVDNFNNSPGTTRRPFSQTLDDKYPTLYWSGFLQTDTGWFAQDDANQRAVGDLDADTGLRRVRLRVDGHVKRVNSYVIDLDFAASGHPTFRDVATHFHEIPVFQNLQFGYFKQPFGMDALTSGRELQFLERPSPFALTPFRQVGFGAYGTSDDERATCSIAGSRYPTDSFGVFSQSSGGYQTSGRLTWLPLYEDNGKKLIHIGLDHAMGDPGDNIVRYAIEPGFFVSDPGTGQSDPTVPVFVDTGDIPTNIYNLFNIELAANYGPFHIISEARWSVVNQIGGPLLTFPGVYVEASYVLTGESRPYDTKHGVFTRVIPDCDFELGRGGGAVDVSAGWAYIDLNDENIDGGRMHTFSLGINWYLHRHAKFTIVALPVRLDTADVGTSKSVVAAARAQLEF